MAEWFYKQEGRRQGPVSSEELRQLATTGELRPTDLVWKEGLARWVHVQKLKGLFAIEADMPAATDTDLGLAVLHYELGGAHLERDEYDLAIAELTHLSLHPRDALAYCRLAQAHRRNDDLVRALSDCDEAIRIDPGLALAYKERGNVHFDQSHWEQALADYGEAIQRDGKFMVAFFNRGLVRFHQCDYAAAIAEFSRAIELDPNYAPAFGYRSMAHLKKGDFEQAKKDCAEATRLDPTFDL